MKYKNFLGKVLEIKTFAIDKKTNTYFEKRYTT